MSKMLIKKTRIMHDIRYETSMSTYNIMNSSPQQAHPFSLIQDDKSKHSRTTRTTRNTIHDPTPHKVDGEAGRGTRNMHDV